MRNSKPITVTLGELQSGVEERLRSGTYSSASEVVRAGLRALQREEVALDEIMRRRIIESLQDSRPDVPMEEVFERLEHRHAERMKAAESDA